MGRRRIGWGKERRPISVSLPRELVILLDQTLPQEHSRSRLFESLLKKHLQQNRTLNDFARHRYYCTKCDHEWTINKFIPPAHYVCRAPARCSTEPKYLGIDYDEGEEEE